MDVDSMLTYQNNGYISSFTSSPKRRSKSLRKQQFKFKNEVVSFGNEGMKFDAKTTANAAVKVKVIPYLDSYVPE